MRPRTTNTQWKAFSNIPYVLTNLADGPNKVFYGTFYSTAYLHIFCHCIFLILDFALVSHFFFLKNVKLFIHFTGFFKFGIGILFWAVSVVRGCVIEKNPKLTWEILLSDFKVTNLIGIANFGRARIVVLFLCNIVKRGAGQKQL